MAMVEQHGAGKNMPYITSVERIGMQQGAVQTWRQAIARMLTTRFEMAIPQISDSLDTVGSQNALEAFFEQAILVNSLEEFQQALGLSRILCKWKTLVQKTIGMLDSEPS